MLHREKCFDRIRIEFCHLMSGPVFMKRLRDDLELSDRKQTLRSYRLNDQSTDQAGNQAAIIQANKLLVDPFVMVAVQEFLTDHDVLLRLMLTGKVMTLPLVNYGIKTWLNQKAGIGYL